MRSLSVSFLEMVLTVSTTRQIYRGLLETLEVDTSKFVKTPGHTLHEGDNTI